MYTQSQCKCIKRARMTNWKRAKMTTKMKQFRIVRTQLLPVERRRLSDGAYFCLGTFYPNLGEGEDNEVDDEEDGEVVGCLCLCVFVCEEDPLAPGG